MPSLRLSLIFFHNLDKKHIYFFTWPYKQWCVATAFLGGKCSITIKMSKSKHFGNFLMILLTTSIVQGKPLVGLLENVYFLGMWTIFPQFALSLFHLKKDKISQLWLLLWAFLF